MDGENNGSKPYVEMDDLGGFNPLFSDFHPNITGKQKTLEVNHYFKNGGSFWKMINPYVIMVVRKPPYKKWWKKP